MLRPAGALRCYPVKCVGIQGGSESAEVAFFNSASVPFHASVSVAVVSVAGKPAAEETRQLSIAARGTARVRVAYKAAEPGMYALTVKTEGERDLPHAGIRHGAASEAGHGCPEAGEVAKRRPFAESGAGGDLRGWRLPRGGFAVGPLPRSRQPTRLALCGTFDVAAAWPVPAPRDLP